MNSNKKLINKIRNYYEHYYRDTLGLPDWELSVERRIDEEREIQPKLKRLENLLGGFNNKRVLDVGCGTGGFILAISKFVNSANGVDPDQKAITICRLKKRALKAENVDFKVGKAERLPFENDYFDIVYCYTVLEHVDDVGKSIKEMVRVVKPGGVIYIEAPNYFSCFEGHYKVFWLPMFPKKIASLYLKLRGRNPAFLKTVNYLTTSKVIKHLSTLPVKVELLANKDKRTQGILRWPLEISYFLFRINPQIELLIKKTN